MPVARDDPDRPDPLFAELYASLPDAEDLEPWLGWCRGVPQVLYLGVGAGRLAVPLSRAGVHLVGVDAHPGMVSHLRRRLPSVEVVQARIEELNLGRTFGFVMAPSHLLCTEERLAAAARHALGRVGLQLMNPYWLAGADHPSVVVHRLGRAQVELEVHYPGGWIHAATVALVWPEELEVLLDRAGLRLEVLRGEDEDASLEDSPTFYALAARRPRRAQIPST